MFKKIRHLIEFLKQNFIVIFIDHNAALNIIKQINITIVFTNKLNFRLIKAFDYIQRFDVELRYKSNKQHIVFNALSRLVNINIDTTFSKKKLNVFFIIVLTKMNKNFRRKIIANYRIDFN